jgi:hypothetical protein
MQSSLIFTEVWFPYIVTKVVSTRNYVNLMEEVKWAYDCSHGIMGTILLELIWRNREETFNLEFSMDMEELC